MEWQKVGSKLKLKKKGGIQLATNKQGIPNENQQHATWSPARPVRGQAPFRSCQSPPGRQDSPAGMHAESN